jgi:hypothetical protein
VTRWQATHFAAQLVKRGLPATVEIANAEAGIYLVRYTDRQGQLQTLRHVGEATEALWLDERQQRRAVRGVFAEGGVQGTGVQASSPSDDRRLTTDDSRSAP